MSRWKQIIVAFSPSFIVLVLHVFVYYFGVYYDYPWVDIPMHFLGGCAIALLVLLIMPLLSQLRALRVPHPFVRFAVVMAFVALAALLWEFMEFGLDFFFDARNQAGLLDTMGDFFFGLLGGGVGFFVLTLYPKARR
jgi:hypothetical protein